MCILHLLQIKRLLLFLRLKVRDHRRKSVQEVLSLSFKMLVSSSSTKLFFSQNWSCRQTACRRRHGDCSGDCLKRGCCVYLVPRNFPRGETPCVHHRNPSFSKSAQCSKKSFLRKMMLFMWHRGRLNRSLKPNNATLGVLHILFKWERQVFERVRANQGCSDCHSWTTRWSFTFGKDWH